MPVLLTRNCLRPCHPWLLLLLLSVASVITRAQNAAQLVALVGKKPIVIEAPYPFVETSRILPDAFAQRHRSISATSRLVAWFIPTRSLQDQLNEKNERYRSLQVQVMKEMEQVRHDAQSLQALYEETMEAQGLARITEDDADAIFNLLDLDRIGRQAGGQRILGMAKLGPASFTLCVATSAEGRDQRGGREVETSATCVTYLLINERIILLAVSGPELTAKELRNSMRLTREWIELLRAHNNARAE